MRFILSFLGILALSSCATYDYERHVGIITFANDGIVLDTKDDELGLAAPISIVFTGFTQTVQETRVISPLKHTDNPNFPYRYRLYTNEGKLPTAGIALGITKAPAKPLAWQMGKVWADFEPNDSLEYFVACTGSEGVNYKIISGDPKKGREVWSTYYYLGYDIEPDCF